MAKGLLENAIDKITQRKNRNASVAPDVKPLRTKKKAKTLDPTKATAKNPKGVQKTKAQGEAERNALRKKRKRELEANKKK